MNSIALLISGHTRDFQNTLPGLVQLKNRLKADVFISSYLDKGTGVRFWRGQKEKTNIITKNEINFINNTLSPIYSQYTPDFPNIPSLSNFKFKNPLVSVENVYKMVLKMGECNRLKQKYEHTHNFKYPLTIRTRFDNEYLELNFPLISPKKLYTSSADNKKYMTDTFFACDSSTMDKIMELEENFGKGKFIPNNFENAEEMFTLWVKENNISLIKGGMFSIKLRDKLFI